MAERHPIPTDKRFQDLTGKRFGLWSVVFYAGKIKLPHNRTLYWLCRCDCGTERLIAARDLRNGQTKSCGCRLSSLTVERLTTHGQSHAPEYGIWQAMKYRCYSKTSKDYCNYGGRGITVSKSWRESYEAFIADMGPRPSDAHSLERLNNDGQYCKANCHWATRKEQNNNKRNTLELIEYNGLRLSIIDMAQHVGVSWKALYARIHRGESAEHAISVLLAKLQASP